MSTYPVAHININIYANILYVFFLFLVDAMIGNMTKTSASSVWASSNNFNPYYHLTSKHDFMSNSCDFDVNHAQVTQASHM